MIHSKTLDKSAVILNAHLNAFAKSSLQKSIWPLSHIIVL